MSRRIFSRFVCVAAVLSALSTIPAKADGDGAVSGYSPYSVFAIGDIPLPGNAYNRSMGGVGVASRNHRYINPLNPASVTARDSLSFMVDFSLFGENRVFRQGDNRSANNLFNIGDCIISFPIWKSLAMMVGIMPYSSTGYGYEYTYSGPILADYGNVTFSSTGIGTIYQIFSGLGFSPFKNFSIGAEAIYYFGSIKKTDNLAFAAKDRTDILSEFSSDLRGVTGSFGMQYEIPLGKAGTVGLGATYRLGTRVGGFLEKNTISTYTSDVIDTLSLTPDRLRFADELGFGISYNYNDKFRAEIDYTRSDWNRTNFGTDAFFALQGENSFETTVSSAIRMGVEYTPNRNDVRYYLKKVSYRGGLYHKNEYYTVSGHEITSNGITLGATFPIFRWYNGLTVAFDFGRRGTIENNLIRESYFNLSVGVNLFDIWFQKPKYD